MPLFLSDAQENRNGRRLIIPEIGITSLTFWTTLGDGSIHMRQLDTGWIKHFSLCCLCLYLLRLQRYRDVNFRNGQKFDFLKNFFGPSCGNFLVNLDGSMPECAQICALHTRPHLTTLRKTETVDGSVTLGEIHKTSIMSLSFWPTL